MKKGFIGPIGDDLPSVIAIVLALSIFFSALLFSLNVYNQKIENLDLLKGAIEISRTLTVDGLMPVDWSSTQGQSLKDKASVIAASYGLHFNVAYKSTSGTSCPDPRALVFNHLVPAWDGNSDSIELKNMYVCVWR